MKNYLLTAFAIFAIVTSCKQTETKVETSENPDGTTTTTTIETNKSTGLDSAKVNATIDKTKAKLEVVGEKLDAAAEKTGEKLQEAGENVKDAANRTAKKVEVETRTTDTKEVKK